MGKAEDGRTVGCVHHAFLHWISPSWPSLMGIGEWKAAAMDLPAPLHLASQRRTCQEAWDLQRAGRSEAEECRSYTQVHLLCRSHLWLSSPSQRWPC